MYCIIYPLIFSYKHDKDDSILFKQILNNLMFDYYKIANRL